MFFLRQNPLFFSFFLCRICFLFSLSVFHLKKKNSVFYISRSDLDEKWATWYYQNVNLCCAFFLSTYLSIYDTICSYLPQYVVIYLSIYLWYNMFLSTSVCCYLSIYPSMTQYVPIYLSMLLSIYLWYNMFLSTSVGCYLSIYLSMMNPSKQSLFAYRPARTYSCVLFCCKRSTFKVLV